MEPSSASSQQVIRQLTKDKESLIKAKESLEKDKAHLHHDKQFNQQVIRQLTKDKQNLEKDKSHLHEDKEFMKAQISQHLIIIDSMTSERKKMLGLMAGIKDYSQIQLSDSRTLFNQSSESFDHQNPSHAFDQIELQFKNLQHTEVKTKLNLSQDEYQSLKGWSYIPRIPIEDCVFLAKIVQVVDIEILKGAILMKKMFFPLTIILAGVSDLKQNEKNSKEVDQKITELISKTLNKKIVKIQARDFNKYGCIQSVVYCMAQNSNAFEQFSLNDFIIEKKKSFYSHSLVSKDKKEVELEQKNENEKWPIVVDYPIEF